VPDEREGILSDSTAGANKTRLHSAPCKSKHASRKNVNYFEFTNTVWRPPLLPSAEFLATDPEIRVTFPALLDFLRRSGSETVSIQPREYSL
jgi:hypothetical protein